MEEELKPVEEETSQGETPEEEFEYPDYEHELVEIIRSDLPAEEKKEKLYDYHYNDIASVLEQLSPEERKGLYRLLGAEEVSEIFAYLDDPSAYLEELSVDTAADIVEQMDADDAVDLLEELDEAKSEAILQHMEAEAQADIRLIQSYDEDEIGAKMTTNFIAIQKGLSVKKAMKAVIDQAAENDNLSTIYVLERDGTLYGAITLQDLIIAREGTDLDTLVTTSYPYVYDHESVADCIEQLKEYSEDSIPVVDNDKQLLGVITSQDLVEAVDEAIGEDYAMLAGLTDEEDLNETLLESMKKRVPWLMVLMVLGLLVSSVVGIFEEPVTSKLTIVVAFQSLILGMAGNVGTQSLAVTIRVLTDEALDAKQKFALVMKEARVGLCNGAILGLLAFVLIGLYLSLGKAKATGFAFLVSGCIGVSMLVAMLVSSLTGTLVPLFFKKIKVDPAVASGPLITTLNDLVAVVSYYGLVWVLLINLLHLVD